MNPFNVRIFTNPDKRGKKRNIKQSQVRIGYYNLFLNQIRLNLNVSKPRPLLDQDIRSIQPLDSPKGKKQDRTKYREEGSKTSGKWMVRLKALFDF